MATQYKQLYYDTLDSWHMLPASVSRANLTPQKVTGHCRRAGSCSSSTCCSCKEHPDQLQVLLRVKGTKHIWCPYGHHRAGRSKASVCREGGWAGFAHIFLSISFHHSGSFVCFSISVTSFLFGQLLFWYGVASGDAVPCPEVLQFSYMLFWS